jgi:hypothetical protein
MFKKLLINSSENFFKLEKLEEKEENKTFIIAKKIEKQNVEMKSLIDERFQNPDNYLDIDDEVIIGIYEY